MREPVPVLGVQYELPPPIAEAAGRADAAAITLRRERSALRSGLIAVMTLDDMPLAELKAYVVTVRGIRYLGPQEVKSIYYGWVN